MATHLWILFESHASLNVARKLIMEIRSLLELKKCAFICDLSFLTGLAM